MPILSGSIEAEGAIVDVLLGWSATAVRQLRSGLHPIPQPVTARALLDTGAETSCFDPVLIRALGLPWRGSAAVNVPATGGLTFSAQHDASVTVLHPSGSASDHLVIGDLLVVEVPLTALGYQALIGRDVLAKCRFLYEGPASQFELNY
jgi:hypothetical protein